MLRDFHLIPGREGEVLFFPESGKLYRVTTELGEQLRHYKDGTAEAPAEAQPILQREAQQPAPPRPALMEGEGEVTSLCLYTAHDCNLACRYCYNQRGRSVAPLAMMSPETARAALDRFCLRPEVEYAVAFYGGEPFLNPAAIRAAIDHAQTLQRDKGIRIRFSATTNGTVMNRELLGLIERHFSAITLSLDGDRAINDLHRIREKSDRRSVHDQVLQTLDLLRHTGVRVTLKGTLTAQGLPHHQASLAYLRRLGAHAAALDPAFGPPQADWALDEQAFEHYVASQVADAADDLDDLEEATGPWNERTFTILAGLLTRRRLHRHCHAGRDLAITASGEIYACHGLVGEPAFAMGRLDQPDSPDFARVHARFAGLDVTTIPECATCWARYLCGGSCYANAWFSRGSVARPDTRHCRLVRPVAEAVIARFAEVGTDPRRMSALLQKMRRQVGLAPAPHHG